MGQSVEPFPIFFLSQQGCLLIIFAPAVFKISENLRVSGRDGIFPDPGRIGMKDPAALQVRNVRVICVLRSEDPGAVGEPVVMIDIDIVFRRFAEVIVSVLHVESAILFIIPFVIAEYPDRNIAVFTDRVFIQNI